MRLIALLVACVLPLAACQTTSVPAAGSTVVPVAWTRAAPVPGQTPESSATPAPGPTPLPPAASAVSPARTPTVPPLTPLPSPTPWLVVQEEAREGGEFPTLADFWEGRAVFRVEAPDTGLPLGESETVVMGNGELRSYLHASGQSAGTVDRCGDPVEFPGCTVIYRSTDGGLTFRHDDPPVCQFDCAACPCEAERDHVVQQQYPRVAYDGQTMVLVYEYLGRVMLRRSTDGLAWSPPEQVDESGVWKLWLRGCPAEERIGAHPFAVFDYECLAGGPPGVMIVGRQVYVFMALGQNPGSMGCYTGRLDRPASSYRRCRNNPLFTGAGSYGPLDTGGTDANAYFDFRTVSSADVVKVGDRYYMFYEGVRGPGPKQHGDSQFALGLARSLTDRIDGPWEKYPANPILVSLPGNVGVGHADVVVIAGRTVLYTSLEGKTRSRLILDWKDGRGSSSTLPGNQRLTRVSYGRNRNRVY